jgi:hypothetical protein
MSDVFRDPAELIPNRYQAKCEFEGCTLGPVDTRADGSCWYGEGWFENRSSITSGRL